MGAIGLDIGGTKLAAAYVGDDGEVRAQARAATPAADGPAAVLDAAATIIDELGAPPATPLGVGSAGTIARADGTVRYATDSLPGWAGTRLCDELGARTGRRVVADNDVNAAALGEWWVGAGRVHDRVLLVAAGTGIGGAFVDGGAVYRGADGGGMEVGHLTVAADSPPCGCGRRGHLEAVASGSALARTYATETGESVPGADVARRAAAGDDTARRVVTESATLLGRVLAGLAAMLDPGIVILTGGAAAAMLGRAVEAFDAELLMPYRHIALVPGELDGHAATVGAARLAMEEL